MDKTTALQHAQRARNGDLESLRAVLAGLAEGSIDLYVGSTQVTATAAELNILDGVTATAAELNDNDLSAKSQAITEAGAIDVDARYVDITGPAASTYAVTLAAPSRAGQIMVIEMTATTATNAVTLALTNVLGGSAATSASFNAAEETLVLISAGSSWMVLAEVGVTLT